MDPSAGPESAVEFIDAGSYTALALKRLRGKPIVECMDFSNVEDVSVLDHLFPKEPSRGQHDPPQSYRTSAKKIREWRQLSGRDQQYIRDPPEYGPSRVTSSRSRSRRASVRNQEEDDDEQAADGEGPGGFELSSLVNQVTTHPTSPQEAAASIESPPTSEITTTNETVARGAPTTAVYKPAADEAEEEVVCKGIGRALLEQKVRVDKESVLKGFFHLVGNAGRYKASYVSRVNKWEHGQQVYGFLLDPSKEDDAEAVSWVCYETEDSEFFFRRRECSGLGGDSECCAVCSGKLNALTKMCRAQANKRDDGLANNANVRYLIYESPSLVIPLLRTEKKQVKLVRQQLYDQKRVHEKLESLPSHFVPNLDAQILFDSEKLKRDYEAMKKRDNVPEKEVLDLLFREAMLIGTKLRNGADPRGIRMSNLYIQFCMCVRASQSAKKHDFIRKVFPMPTGRTMQEYHNADSTAEDGVMFETLAQHEEMFKQNSSDKDLSVNSPYRRGTMGFDSHNVRGKLAFCPQTGELVAYAHDAFHLDVILEQFKRTIEKEDRPSDSNDPSDTDDDDEDLPLGKHFMIFMFTTWAADGHSVQFMAARYCLSSISARWLVVHIVKVVVALAYFGFVVNALGFDGATENRSAIKQLLTISLKQLIGDLRREVAANYPDVATDDPDDDPAIASEPTEMAIDSPDLPAATDTSTGAELAATDASADDANNAVTVDDMVDTANALGANDLDYNSLPKYGEDDLPWNMKMAFPHPTIEGVNIVANADMPHAVKKCVNALENSGKEDHERSLIYKGWPLSLKMLHDVWKVSPDSTSESQVMVSRRLTREHFEKNSYNRMRAPLAFGIMSTSMYRLVHFYKHRVPDAPPGVYDSVEIVIPKFDRFIDVMNGTKAKGCSNIDSANHQHVYELLNFAKFIYEWKNEAGPNKEHFFPSSTYEDLIWTALGTVVIARTQLTEGTAMVQKRGGSDVCEHTFCKARGRNANADAINTRGILSHVTATNAMSMAGARKGNVGGETVYVGNELGNVVKRNKRQKPNEN